MKKVTVILFILFSSFAGIAQEKGDFRLGVYGQAIYSNDKILPQFGISGEYFLNHFVSLNYKYGLGANSNGQLMGHINPSILGLALAGMASIDFYVYSFLIPEGVSFHVYPNDNLEIAPYIAPLGAEIYLYEDSPIVLSCSFGINFHIKPTPNLSITPNAGAIVLYRDGEILPTYGFALNYNFQQLFNE